MFDARRDGFGASKSGNTIGAASTIEQLIAADDYLATDATTLRLYRAFLGREPDVTGTKYWIGQTRQGTSLAVMVDSFLISPEYTGRYGTNVSNQAFLDVLYGNVFGRGADPHGFAYWLRQLESGVSRSDVVYNVAANPEFTTRYSYGG